MRESAPASLGYAAARTIHAFGPYRLKRALGVSQVAEIAQFEKTRQSPHFLTSSVAAGRGLVVDAHAGTFDEERTRVRSAERA